MSKVIGTSRAVRFACAAWLALLGLVAVDSAAAQPASAPPNGTAPASAAAQTTSAAPAAAPTASEAAAATPEAAAPSAAGQPPPPGAAVAPSQGASEATPPPAQPAPTGDTASELAALRAEVDALKAKQEQADVAALLSESDAAAAQATEQEPLRIYGFTDFGIDKYFMHKREEISLLRPTSATTFVFGNLNVYLDATPIEHLRTLIEVRLTTSPHGEETQLGPPLGTSYERIDTTAFDFSSPSSQAQLRLGSLYIERAFSEYQFSDLFKLQWGMFLNPFGIWNLDHGSPTLIALMLPTFIASQMVPTRLLGLHLHGSAFFGSSELGYAVHVTNGRTPLDFDLTEDKAVGARLYLAHDGNFGRLVLGASGYWGTYVDQRKDVVVTPERDFANWVDTINYTEEIVGFDVALDVGDLRVRSEAVLRWVVYKDGKFERVVSADGTEQYLPNRLEYSGYAMAAYRTPWRLEPYVEAEVSSKSYTLPRWAGTSRASPVDHTSLYLSVGLNLELTTRTLLKTQLVWDRAYDAHFKHKSTDLPILFVRAVDTF